jgi:hypothetical protein
MKLFVFPAVDPRLIETAVCLAAPKIMDNSI